MKIKIDSTANMAVCGGLLLLLGMAGIAESTESKLHDGAKHKSHTAAQYGTHHKGHAKTHNHDKAHNRDKAHQVMEMMQNKGASILHDAPNWLARTDFSANIEHNSAPTWAIETIQPLWQTPDTLAHTFFMQGRAANRSNDNTINLGAGYRYLTSDENLLYGINGFYDATTKYHHHRTGLGGEIFTRIATWRANYYHAESKDKIIKTENGISTTQQALSGWDADVDVPVPYVAWSRFGFTYFHWNTAKLAKLNGQKFWVRMNWTDNWQTEVGRTQDQVNTPRLFAKLNFLFGRNPSNEYTWQDHRCTQEPVAKLNLAQHTLDKVRRHNDIVIEESTSGGAGVVIGRGT